MKQRDKERYRIYDQNARDQKSKTFYDSREWQLTRSDILSACGIDVYVYMTEGVILAADTVHHIIPLKEAWDKRYCHRCYLLFKQLSINQSHILHTHRSFQSGCHFLQL